MTWWHPCHHLCRSLAICSARVLEGEESIWKDNIIQKLLSIGERAMSAHHSSYNARTLQCSSNNLARPNLQLRLQTARPSWQVVKMPNIRSGTSSRRYCKLFNLDGVMQSTTRPKTTMKSKGLLRRNERRHYAPHIITWSQKSEVWEVPSSKYQSGDWITWDGLWWYRVYLSCQWEESRVFIRYEKPTWYGLGSKPDTWWLTRWS